MNDLRTILVCRKTILCGPALPQAQRGIPICILCMPTSTRRHAKSGQRVCAWVAQATLDFEFVTLKEDTAGFSVVPNPLGQAMERYCIGSVSTSTLKTGNKQSYTWRRD